MKLKIIQGKKSYNDYATKKLEILLNEKFISKTNLSEKLGVSRPTLDTRIKKHNWKKGELAIIDLL